MILENFDQTFIKLEKNLKLSLIFLAAKQIIICRSDTIYTFEMAACLF